MSYRKSIRAGYLAKAIMWGVVLLICLAPAMKYLGEYARYVQGGIQEFYRGGGLSH